MKKLLICCLAILLSGVPVLTTNAASSSVSIVQTGNGDILLINDERISPDVIVSNESYSFSPDATSMQTSITMEYPGEVVPNRSVTITRIINGNTYTGTVYLISYWYIVDTNTTTANYEGTLYLQSSTS
ncbi:MAG: hypothetical protein IJ335_12435 [Lachnospiraceae bacterium]|nr:hypothetical protein [Lachnospiraceae bacterium]